MDFISGREGMAEIFMTLRWSQVGFQLVETICSWKQHCERAKLPKEALWWLLLKPVKFQKVKWGSLAWVHEFMIYLWHQLTASAESMTKSFLCTVHDCTTETFQDVSELFWKGYVVFPWKETIKKSFSVWKERPRWLFENTVCSRECLYSLLQTPNNHSLIFLWYFIVYKHFYMHPIILSPDHINT